MKIVSLYLLPRLQVVYSVLVPPLLRRLSLLLLFPALPLRQPHNTFPLSSLSSSLQVVLRFSILMHRLTPVFGEHPLAFQICGDEMALDPLTAIGLAGNIVQFIDFSFKFVSKASESNNLSMESSLELSIWGSLQGLWLRSTRSSKDSLHPPTVAVALAQEQRRIYDLQERCSN
jgi:hypothetical protein